jgi:hypothetical protein
VDPEIMAPEYFVKPSVGGLDEAPDYRVSQTSSKKNFVFVSI